MKSINRMHIAINVDSMDQSKEFYTKLLGHEPTKVTDDQIDWVLDNPATHLSIFHSDTTPKGLEHIGVDFNYKDYRKAQSRMNTVKSVLLDPNGIKVELYSHEEKPDPYKVGLTVNIR